MTAANDGRVTFSQLTPPTDERAQLMEDVRHGFTAYRKYLPSKYFYDDRGSALFEQINAAPEYYLARAETEILTANATSIMERTRPDELVELGSGSSLKTRLLIEAMREAGGGSRYVPIDISQGALRAAADELCAAYPWLEVDAQAGDYLADLDKVRRRGRRLIVFLGSTIGNYVPTLRVSLLRSVAAALDARDTFLLGVDLVKDTETMVAAYDDAAGLSAAFNLNVLAVVNRALDGDIPLDAFEHVARFDPGYACMMQSLRATRPVVANIRALDLAVTFFAGEEIHTEVSCKFTRDRVEGDFGAVGMRVDDWLTDSEDRYAVALGSHG